MPTLDILNLSIIFAVTFVIRIFTVTLGGGGIILIPMLIFFGLPPSQAIATNRLGAFSHNFSILKFHQYGQVKWKMGFYLMLPALIGTVVGSYLVININQDLFGKLIGGVIIISIILIAYKNHLGIKEFTPSKNRLVAGWFLALIAGLVGGLFSQTGLWFNYVYLFLGLTFLQTAATRKISGFINGLVSITMFIVAGLIKWDVAMVMFIASGLGSWLGAGWGIKIGNVWIKRLFIIVAVIGAIKLLFF
jgi:uncharacterized membrane protein YfcA